MSDALRRRDRVRVNRTRRHREQDGFSCLWQPSPYPGRPEFHHRRRWVGRTTNNYCGGSIPFSPIVPGATTPGATRLGSAEYPDPTFPPLPSGVLAPTCEFPPAPLSLDKEVFGAAGPPGIGGTLEEDGALGAVGWVDAPGAAGVAGLAPEAGLGRPFVPGVAVPPPIPVPTAPPGAAPPPAA
jgi:hypothetical protein